MGKENQMFSIVIDFANVLFAALSVGAMFGVWLVFNPAGLEANFYVALHQQSIRKLNKAMPALGAATILLTIAPQPCSGGKTARGSYCSSGPPPGT
jgi:hypothetical protein